MANEQLVAKLAFELYDRFVMGGWEPQDAYPVIREMLDGSTSEPALAPQKATAENLAQQFHEIYERLAPYFGYKTRDDSAKPWADIPKNNRLLMIAVCQEILGLRVETSAAPEKKT